MTLFFLKEIFWYVPKPVWCVLRVWCSFQKRCIQSGYTLLDYTLAGLLVLNILFVACNPKYTKKLNQMQQTNRSLQIYYNWFNLNITLVFSTYPIFLFSKKKKNLSDATNQKRTFQWVLEPRRRMNLDDKNAIAWLGTICKREKHPLRSVTFSKVAEWGL